MVDLHSNSRGPGFQRSETSSAELHIYPQPHDQALYYRNRGANQDIKFDGRKKDSQTPSLISIATHKEMGDSGGTWQATVKQANPFRRHMDLREMIADDAWVDIHFNRHNRRFFTMRGMVDEIRRVKSSAGGATTTTYTITGRDFTKVWELTPIWFNKYIQEGKNFENLASAATMRVFTNLGKGGSVPGIIKKYLIDFLKDLGSIGRATWLLPKTMPGLVQKKTFIDNITIIENDFLNDPKRLAIAPNFMDPSGANAWAMAQEWSDPAFVEMFSDLVSKDGFGVGDAQLSEDNSQMGVVVRDRPFPVTTDNRNRAETGINSPYFFLPMLELAEEDVVTDDLGRGGAERFNAFFVSPQVTQEFMQTSAIEVTAPLWDKDDMEIHGFRRFDINSRYVLDAAAAAEDELHDSLLSITVNQRKKVRDWYCMNPYLYNGNLEVGRGEPRARIGMRCKVPNENPANELTAYIESVDHSWEFGKGIKTTLGVTRGWYGTDNDYMATLNSIASKYGGNRQDQGSFDVPASNQVIT